jgi:hypothetical protein
VTESSPEAAEADETPHRLGEFRFANTLTFVVYGDDPRDPMAVRVLLDDGCQSPYQILAIEGLGCFCPPPETTWREGWISPGDPWARIIHGNTLGVVRQARTERLRS